MQKKKNSKKEGKKETSGRRGKRDSRENCVLLRGYWSCFCPAPRWSSPGGRTVPPATPLPVPQAVRGQQKPWPRPGSKQFEESQLTWLFTCDQGKDAPPPDRTRVSERRPKNASTEETQVGGEQAVVSLSKKHRGRGDRAQGTGRQVVMERTTGHLFPSTLNGPQLLTETRDCLCPPSLGEPGACSSNIP